jgi:hypothetical protein
MNVDSYKTTDTARTLSMPALLLRLEGLIVVVGAVAFYAHLEGSFLLFVLLALAPDLSMIGYGKNPRIGSVAYNVVHTYVAPGVLAALAFASGSTLALQIALIWFTHIGGDRLLGFGLKYASDFKDTHLQRV